MLALRTCMTYLIRDATALDLDAIEAIYAHYVLHSTCTMQLVPGRREERQAWFDAHGERHPILVAESEGIVVGWASISPYHARAGYSPTVEDSIYIHHAHRGLGIGGRFLDELIARSNAIGHHSIMASVSADQAASLRVHEKAGFFRVAHLREVGFKLGKWIDVVFLQKMLDCEH